MEYSGGVLTVKGVLVVSGSGGNVATTDSVNTVASNLSTLSGSLGDLATKDTIDSVSLIADGIITAAKLGTTIIDGGYIKTALVNTDALKTALITADNINALTCAFDKGTIGGWTIDSSSLRSTNAKLLSSGVLALGTATTYAYNTANCVYLDGANNKVSFGTALTFDAGALSVSGNVTANGGKIGNLTINANGTLLSSYGNLSLAILCPSASISPALLVGDGDDKFQAIVSPSQISVSDTSSGGLTAHVAPTGFDLMNSSVTRASIGTSGLSLKDSSGIEYLDVNTTGMTIKNITNDISFKVISGSMTTVNTAMTVNGYYLLCAGSSTSSGNRMLIYPSSATIELSQLTMNLSAWGGYLFSLSSSDGFSMTGGMQLSGISTSASNLHFAVKNFGLISSANTTVVPDNNAVRVYATSAGYSISNIKGYANTNYPDGTPITIINTGSYYINLVQGGNIYCQGNNTSFKLESHSQVTLYSYGNYFYCPMDYGQ